MKPAADHRRAEAEPEPVARPPGPVDAVKAAALLPEDLIQNGEIVILLLKPHPLFIILAWLKLLVMLILVTVIGVVIDEKINYGASRQNIIITGSIVILARLVWQFLEWLSRTYVLTDRRVIAVGGVLRVRVFEAPLSRVAHTEVVFSIRERLFMLGSIGFFTAGTAGAEAFWLMLAKPMQIHRTVIESLRRYRG
jgi:uncharacterized membrane protein YdbT with pleckstrin-like domain